MTARASSFSRTVASLSAPRAFVLTCGLPGGVCCCSMQLCTHSMGITEWFPCSKLGAFRGGAGRALWARPQLEGQGWWGWGYIINADFALTLYPLCLPVGTENSEKTKRNIPSRKDTWKSLPPVLTASGFNRERHLDPTSQGSIWMRCAAGWGWCVWERCFESSEVTLECVLLVLMT